MGFQMSSAVHTLILTHYWPESFYLAITSEIFFIGQFPMCETEAISDYGLVKKLYG